MKKVYFFILMMCALHIAHATDYYAAPGLSSGSGSGTSGDPWELFDALSKIPADQGHTLILKNGTYTVTESVNIPTGVNMRGETNDSTLVVIYAEGDDASPIIRMNSAGSSVFAPVKNGNQTISYLTVESNYTTNVGIAVFSRNNVKLKSLQVKKMEETGLFIAAFYFHPDYIPSIDPQEPTRVTGSEIAYCYVYNCGKDLNGNGNYSHNMGYGGWAGGSIHHNVIEDYDRGDGENLGGYGLKSHNGGNSRNVHVFNNYIRVTEDVRNWGCKFTMEFDNPLLGMEYYNNTLVDGGVSWTGDGEADEAWKPELEPGQHRLRFYNNHFIGYKVNGVGGQAIENYIEHSQHFNNYCEGFQTFMKISPKGGEHNSVGFYGDLEYFNNVFVGTWPGFDQSQFMIIGGDEITPNSGYLVYNNVVYNTRRTIITPRSTLYDSEFKNNIFVNIDEVFWKEEGNSSNCVVDNNIIYNLAGDLTTSGANVSIINTHNNDPELQLSGDMPYPYYAPNSSSYVVDQGVVIPGFTDGYTGSAPDLGAYEYGITQPVSVDSVMLPDTMNIHVGKIEGANPVIYPINAANQGVTWAIGNETYATVDDYGIISALVEGTTTLTVTTKDGGHTDDAIVNVIFVPVAEVAIDQVDTVQLVEGNKVSLSATVSPLNATNKSISWSSSNSLVASVSGTGSVEGLSPGISTITVTTQNGSHTDDVIVEVLSASSYPAVWWKMENNFADSSGSHHGDDKSNGILPVFDNTDKKVGEYSAVLERDNENWVDVGHNDFKDEIDSLTFTAWIKASSTTEPAVIFEEGGSASGFSIRIESDSLHARMRANDAENLDVSVPFTATDWKHIAVRYCISKIEIFIDGRYVSTSTNTNFTQVNSHSNPAGLGGRNGDDVFGGNGSGDYFDGKLDDVRIYNAFLNKMQIAQTAGLEPVNVSGISIDQTSPVDVQGTTTLTATINPSDAIIKTVVWSSADESIATINEMGEVVAVSMGTTVITATTEDGGFTDNITIEITSTTIPVTGVNIVEDKQIIFAGITITLTANVLPLTASNKTKSWHTTNSNIATVTDGIVIGIMEGVTDVIVETEDGEFSDTLSMTVLPVPPNTLPWSEAFTGLADGTTFETGTASDWSISDGVPNGSFSVQAEQFAANQLGVWMTWYSDTIGISGSVVNISVDVNYEGSVDSGDDIELYYKIDGGDEILIEAFNGSSALPKTVTKEQISGNTLEIIVKAYNSGGDEYYFFDNIQVTEATSLVPVTGVVINQNNQSISVENTVILSATISPSNASNKEVYWSSGNTAVASVNSQGMVTGVSAGTTTISVTTSDKGFTDNIMITVTENVVSVDSIRIDNVAPSINVGSSITLSATLYPANATNTQKWWSSDDILIATIDSTTGVLTGISEGSAFIYVTSRDGNLKDSITVEINDTTSNLTTAGNALQELIIYPNPAAKNGSINIKMFGYPNEAEILILDMKGKTLYRNSIDFADSTHFEKIPSSLFNSGIYLVAVITKNDVTYQKLIVD